MKELERHDIAICTACLMLAANGDVENYGPNPRPDITDDETHLYELPDDDAEHNASSRHAESTAPATPAAPCSPTTRSVAA